MTTDDRKALADCLVAANGESPESIRNMARMLVANDDGCSLSLAKWHIKQAIKRRHGEALPTAGGLREPAGGRPPKAKDAQEVSE